MRFYEKFNCILYPTEFGKFMEVFIKSCVTIEFCNGNSVVTDLGPLSEVSSLIRNIQLYFLILTTTPDHFLAISDQFNSRSLRLLFIVKGR